MIAKLRNALRKFRQKLRESTPYLIVTVLIFLFIVAYLFHRIFITVPAGHAGIHFKWFGGGTDVNTIYGEGLHVIAPWNWMTIYNLRIQEVDRDYDVLTSDGLAIKTTMSIRWRPTHRLLGMLHKEHGPDYVESYLLAELGSSARRIIGLVTPAEFYSSARDSIERAIDDHLRWELREVDEFLTTKWPNPPGYDEFMQAAEARGTLDALEAEGANIDSFKAEITRSLNLQLVFSQIPDATVRKLAEEHGDYHVYLHLSTRHDSLLDLNQKLDRQLKSVRSAMMDTEAEKETGLVDLHHEEGDTTIIEHYNTLLAKKQSLEKEAKQTFKTLDAILTYYDRYFLVVDIHDVLIKNITLPPQIAKAIQNKLEQEQIAEEFKFRLIRERREAERKRIEAKGIQDFQTIVIDGITEELLKWKGIEATLQLSQSENAKVIVIGAGEDGLPIILNTSQ